MTKEEVIEAVKVCILGENCDNCQLRDKLTCQEELLDETLKLLKENEPAPAGTDTSSKENKSQLNDTAKLRICQEALKEIKESLLLIYEDMTNEEQRAWELGEIFNQMINLLKSGDNK